MGAASEDDEQQRRQYGDESLENLAQSTSTGLEQTRRHSAMQTRRSLESWTAAAGARDITLRAMLRTRSVAHASPMPCHAHARLPMLCFLVRPKHRALTHSPSLTTIILLPSTSSSLPFASRCSLFPLPSTHHHSRLPIPLRSPATLVTAASTPSFRCLDATASYPS